VAAAVEARDKIQRPINAVFLAMNDVAFAAEFLKQAAAQKLDLPLFGGYGMVVLATATSCCMY